jgi:hypothetical protein
MRNVPSVHWQYFPELEAKRHTKSMSISVVVKVLFRARAVD